MQTILITAYAINPYKGSEDGTGWNWIHQLAKYNRVIVFTRENNLPHIERYLREFKVPHEGNMRFMGYDLPKYQRFWKRGSFGALPYFYLWQRTIVNHIREMELDFDIAHNLNFHNDWIPNFLWQLNKPTVWGPIGHHSKVPKEFVLPPYGILAYLKDRMRWWIKLLFWVLSPNLKKGIEHTEVILAVNKDVENRIPGDSKKVVHMPAIGAPWKDYDPESKKAREYFEILSVGRFVPLKGFDLCIKAFAQFYHELNPLQKDAVRLTIVGKGPQKKYLKELAEILNVKKQIRFIDWIAKDKLEEIYEQTDLFLFPSHEGAGMVIPEAFVYGIPVVCLDNTGPGESIDRNSGIGVPYNNGYKATVESLALALQRICGDTKYQEQLSKGARQRYETWFDWEVKGKIVHNIYTKILKNEALPQDVVLKNN